MLDGRDRGPTALRDDHHLAGFGSGSRCRDATRCHNGRTSHPDNASELEIDEGRDADRPEGVDHEEAAGQRQALRDDRGVRENRAWIWRIASSGTNWLAQHRPDREQEERGHERRRAPRGEQSLEAW